MYATYELNGIYEAQEQATGELTITRFDLKARIVSGRFHFIGIDSETGRQVHVTDGRFDVGF